jgi:hypothetical protein
LAVLETLVRLEAMALRGLEEQEEMEVALYGQVITSRPQTLLTLPLLREGLLRRDQTEALGQQETQD